MRKLFFIVLFLAAPCFCFGQGQGNVWHFGYNAGIDFNSGSAVNIYGPIHTNEGSATICDASGNLLFSTDGITVFNSLGNIMGNGLFGHQSTTQSALIVPMPENSSKYYIFTADQLAGTHGICYSIVDMNLNSGLGGMISINNQLIAPACEKLTATINSNGIDFWLVVHAFPSNEFYAYPITSSGILTPVITPIGMSIDSTYNTIGYLKVSPNGQKIAAARNGSSNDDVEIFDFDNLSGYLSNYISIPNTNDAYGISFSPDNSKLYISNPSPWGINILQYDLSISNFQNLPDIILQGSPIYHGSLQLAPDGKIYCANYTVLSNTLGVINNPNASGVACNYVDSAFPLSSGTNSMMGLPNFIDGYFGINNCSVNLGADILMCTNSSAILDAGAGYTNQYIWNTSSTSQSIHITNSGIYSVTVTNSTGCITVDSIAITQPLSPGYFVNSQTDSINCTGTGFIDLDATGGTGSYTYQWSNGATTEDLDSLNAGTYTVTITDSVGCVVTDPPITIVQINDMQVSNTSSNNLKCHDDTNGFINVTVLNGLSPNNYEWSNGATTEDLNNLTAGTYSVIVSDAGGCTASETVVISAPNQVVASLTIAADTVFCSVTGGTPGYHYHWSTGATTAFIDSATNGTYSVTVSDINNCTALATLTIDAVSTIDGDTDFEIYPNPASEELIVKSEKLFNATISVTDILGRTVQSLKFKVLSPVAIDVSNYSKGVYFIKLVSAGGVTVVKKFVVVH